LRDLRCRKQ